MTTAKRFKTQKIGISINDEEEEILNKELEVLSRENAGFDLIDIKFLYKDRTGVVFYLIIFSCLVALITKAELNEFP